jgi:hypothetical protein
VRRVFARWALTVLRVIAYPDAVSQAAVRRLAASDDPELAEAATHTLGIREALAAPAHSKEGWAAAPPPTGMGSAAWPPARYPGSFP